MRALFVIILLVALVLPSGQAPASPPIDISAEDLQTQAAQGDATAQVHLGLLYHSGDGVPQDYVKARQWYEKAAAQGDVRAQVNLAALYDEGHGVPQDYATARAWYEKAATQGHAGAQSNLGGAVFQRTGRPAGLFADVYVAQPRSGIRDERGAKARSR